MLDFRWAEAAARAARGVAENKEFAFSAAV
jgi:hypothetical protein